MRVEDQHLDVLQNIEFGIVSAFKDHPEMSDHDVMHVLEVLMDSYVAEKIGRPPRASSLSDTERELMAGVRTMCEWRLGRATLAAGPRGRDVPDPEPTTIDVILLCLKRLIKSVQKWNRERGRQGYLRFIARFVR